MTINPLVNNTFTSYIKHEISFTEWNNRLIKGRNKVLIIERKKIVFKDFTPTILDQTRY